MEKVKEVASAVTGSGSDGASKGVFEKGYNPTPQSQSHPGEQGKMGPTPVSDKLPTDHGYQTYKAAGKLVGRKALITGGDSGIGRAVGILFAMEGATVTITHLEAEEKDAIAAASEIKQAGQFGGGVCHTLVADLTKKETCKTIVDQAAAKMDGLDILIPNHAYQMTQHDIKDLPEEQWEHTFQTNINSFFYLCKYALPYLLKHKTPTIVMSASINAYIGMPKLLDYTSTKGAIVAFTRGLSNQQIENGLRVNCVCPGPIWTPLLPATMTMDMQASLSGTPMKRPGQPSEVATCFVFLASPDSSFISGQSLHPNGGSVING